MVSWCVAAHLEFARPEWSASVTHRWRCIVDVSPMSHGLSKRFPGLKSLSLAVKVVKAINFWTENAVDVSTSLCKSPLAVKLFYGLHWWLYKSRVEVIKKIQEPKRGKESASDWRRSLWGNGLFKVHNFLFANLIPEWLGCNSAVKIKFDKDFAEDSENWSTTRWSALG